MQKLKETDKLQYPVVRDKKGQKKSFVQKLFDLMKYQEQNPGETFKSSFRNQDAKGETISHLKIYKQLFQNCNFQTAKIVGCVFIDCVFIKCNFSGATMYNVLFKSTDPQVKQGKFTNCNFTDAQMQDVNAETYFKRDCILNDIDLSKNVIGISENDAKVIEDSYTPTVTPSGNSSSYEKVKEILSNWTETENQCFELFGQDDENCGLAIYPTTAKNTAEKTDIWEFVFFYGNESVFMSEYNLFDLTTEEIEEKIEQWKSEILIENSDEIMRNLLNIIDED